MGCLNSVFKMWSQKILYKEKNTGEKGREISLRKKTILRALLAALIKLSSALSLVFKAIPRPMIEETVGMVWVLSGLWDGECK